MNNMYICVWIQVHLNVYSLTLDNIIGLETMDPLSRNLEDEEIMENMIHEDTSQYLKMEGHD